MRVTTRFIGRLGNNMFQAAAVIGYAKKHNIDWFLPTENRESPNFYRFFPDFNIRNKQLEVYNGHAPTQFNFQNIPFYPMGVCLVGFFQSLKYFEHCEDEIKTRFKLNIDPKYKDCVSIHVRRGDYVRYAADFPPITMDYINTAMEHFPGKEFVIFSDDIEWCQANIKGGTYPNGNEFEDLSVMASCGDHIIANSSFSWWGAYLGHNPDKKIISPHHTSWFGKANGVKAPPVDLIPNSWHQIKFR